MILEAAGKREIVRDFAEHAINIYHSRVCNVAVLIREVLNHLIDFNTEQERMLEEVKVRLCNTRCLRKRDFELIVSDMRKNQREREYELESLLLSFIQRENEMVDHLKSILENRSFTLADFQKIKEEILKSQAEREKQVGRALRNFHLEIEEAALGLQRLLGKGAHIRIRDLRQFVNDVYFQREERDGSWGKIWDEFWVIREKINQKWQKVAF